MTTLIPLSDFVLEQLKIEQSTSEFKEVVSDYTKFLRQPLRLGMFVPVDSHGVILEPLKFCCSGHECGCMGMPVNVGSNEEIDEYYEAEKKVLFTDAVTIDTSPFYTTKRVIINLSSESNFRVYTELCYHNGTVEKQEFPNNKNMTIENLVKHELTLTPSALKAIGIKE